MNKIILTGRLVKDVELKRTQSGKEVVKSTIAVQRDYKNSQGEYETDFIYFTCFGNAARGIASYTKRGDKIAIEGRLQTSSYEKEGKKYCATEVMVDKVEFIQPINRKNENNEAMVENEKAISSLRQEEIEIDDDDLPF